MKSTFIALLCLSLPSILFAQKPPVKFGKLDDALVKMTSHPLDSSADAIVLMDYGTTSFKYTNESGFVYKIDRVTRIKVLKKDGLGFGDFEIPYYHKNSSFEKVTALKGYTYNYIDGSVVKSKLTKSSIFDEETNDNWGQKKVSMPDVKVGSVIELTYSITSPFTWNLATWEFQSKIPTVYSEYRVSVPEYFDYQLLHSGYHPLTINEKSVGQSSITYQVKHDIPQGTLKSGEFIREYETEKVDFKVNNNRWVAKDVPSFELEPLVANPNDYLSKIEFELRGTRYPNSHYKAYMGTWQSLNTSFLENTRFGDATKRAGFIKSDLEKISTLNSDLEKITTLVNLVRNQIEWNKRYARYTTSTLRKAWLDKRGSTADINLIIVAGLRKLGFDTDPVLISTRGHGMVRDQYAISNQFNSVIAMVKLKDGIILLDGTDRFLPISVLPEKCLNGKGWRVSSTAPGWVQINPTTSQESVLQATLEIDPSGSIKGTIDMSEKGYAGYSATRKFKAKGDEKYLEDFQNKNENWLIEDHEFIEGSNYDDPFKSKFTVELEEELIGAAKILYFNPTLNTVMEENPFKIEKREYPVDFAYPIKSLYIFKFKLPDGYVVEDLPKSIAFALPNKNALFRYNLSVVDNSIQVMIDFRINKTMFAQTEYPAVKQFYDQVVQKCAEQVVIKKSTP